MARESLESLCQKAQAALSQGQAQEALEYYQRALTLRADHPDAHYGLATVFFLLGDLEASVDHFRQVTKLEPTKAGAHINLGAVYNRLGRHDEAIASLRRGISLDHNRAEGYYNLGLVYRKLGQIDMAIQAYREATRVNPRMGDAHYNIANIYLERGQFPQAVTHYKQALEVRPNWEKALRGLEHAEQLLEGQEEASASKAPGTDPGSKMASSSGTRAPTNPERPVDPQVHGELLRSLHRGTIDADTMGRNLLQTLMERLEAAIKELSTTLLYPDSPSREIQENIRRFEEAVALVREQEEHLQNSVERIRVLGEQLMKS